MTEQQYVEAIYGARERLPEGQREVFSLVEQAIRDHPRSARLWCLRGDTIQLVGIRSGAAPYPPEEVLRSYEEAARIDPDDAEVHEEIGYYYDVLTDAPQKALPAFRKAIALGAGKDAYLGLARVLAELGDDGGALSLLDGCPYCDDSEVRTLHGEIQDGQWSP